MTEQSMIIRGPRCGQPVHSKADPCVLTPGHPDPCDCGHRQPDVTPEPRRLEVTATFQMLGTSRQDACARVALTLSRLGLLPWNVTADELERNHG